MAKLRLTLYRDDTLHLEHGEIDKGEVFRRSELDERNELTEDSLEGMGYCDIEQRYPDQSIEGLKELGEKLYVVKKGPLIP